MMTRALSGRSLCEIGVEDVLAGEIRPRDVRIHPETLRCQAELAERNGNLQLGENLRRAAELTALTDDQVLAIYEAMRPGRSTKAKLLMVAADLEGRDAPMCAALVREAAEVYETRGLFG
jgi:propanediol dehydratase small subunit